jgi:HSP20 family molecular chaperone IbpA
MHRGKDSLEIIVELPGVTSQENVIVKCNDDEIIIEATRSLPNYDHVVASCMEDVNSVTIPISTTNLKLQSNKLDNGYLTLSFEIHDQIEELV